VIFDNNGTVDKFIGDCVMAYWGDPIASDDDAFMAVKTALEVKEKVNELRIQNEQAGKLAFDVKIGINTGDALLGLSGSEKIMSYTAMGDAINVAARLEASCSKLNKDILIAESTYHQVTGKINAQAVEKIALKGKTEKVFVYEPIGLINEKSAEQNNIKEKKEETEIRHAQS
jgi:adenylate cyclase